VVVSRLRSSTNQVLPGGHGGGRELVLVLGDKTVPHPSSQGSRGCERGRDRVHRRACRAAVWVLLSTSTSRTSPMVRCCRRIRVAASGFWNLVAVAAAVGVFVFDHVAGRGQIGDDPIGAALGDPTVAAMSRRRTPGSWAMQTRTRAWLVRKLHSVITNYP